MISWARRAGGAGLQWSELSAMTVFTLIFIAAHVRIYWPSAVFMPENGHFSVFLKLFSSPDVALGTKS
ncbi:MAG: hypothetical protein HYX42_05910 [Polaromonas sp.]|nr:hypothetical protein [Polaromonas sp.]